MRLATSSPGLLTDLYQLTMGQGYWNRNMASRRSVFHLFYRRAPFGAAGVLSCGLSSVIEFLESFRFESADVEYLASLQALDGRPLFETGYLDALRALRFDGDLWAVEEGRCVFPREPLLRVEGPLLVTQLIETALLTLINFETLIATKAARIRLAAGELSILDFGLRRAQGPDGGLTASRAAYVGGCDASSNVLAGKTYGIPLRGTHAHSWVMCFDNESEAFDAYAESLPGNVVLLIDTYNIGQGIENAISTGRRLRERGNELYGVRLDSGDLAQGSRECRKRLDAEGFESTKIVVSGDLDEYRIRQLLEADAPIDIFGVGTRLITAFDEPALGGVYKLGLIEMKDGSLQGRLKVSEDAGKSTLPGRLQVGRVQDSSGELSDIIYDVEEAAPPYGRDVLQQVMKSGRRTVDPLPLSQIRDRAQQEIQECSRWLWPDGENTSAPVELSNYVEQHRRRIEATMPRKPA